MKNGWYSNNFEEIRKLIEIDGLSSQEIADKFSVKPHQVRSLISRKKLNYIGGRSHKNWTLNEIEELRELLLLGKSIDELEDIFNGRHSRLSIIGIISNRGKNLNLIYTNTKISLFSITKKVIDTVVNLYSNNITIDIISSSTGLSERKIIKILKNNNILVEDSKELSFNSEDSKSKLTRDFLYSEIILNKKSFTQLSKELNLGIDFVIKCAKKNNIVKERKGGYVRKGDENKKKILKLFLTEKEISSVDIKSVKIHEIISKDYLLDKLNKKISPFEIGKLLGVSSSTIYKSAKYHNIHFPKTSDFDLDFWEDMYIKQGKTIEDISDLTKLSVHTLYKHLKKLFPNHKSSGKYSSIGEKIIADVLDSLNIPFLYNDIKGTNIFLDHKISIDFTVNINDKTYWIEYNGQQHYKFIPCIKTFYNDGNKFINYQVNRDNCIREYCKNNSIILIEIPYTFKSTRKIKSVLSKILLEGKDPNEVINLDRFINETNESINIINKQNKNNNEEI